MPDRLHIELPPYNREPEKVGVLIWSALLVVVVGLVGAVVIAHRDLAAIAARDAAIAQARACGLPQNNGDRVVLVVHNRGGQLVATCQPVTDWRAPERAFK
jgi:hypothetical protein